MTRHASIDDAASERIQLIRYVMILGIVVLHTPPYETLDQLDETGFDLLKAFFSHGLFRATTPTLTTIAGFLLFRYGLDLQPAKLLRAKTRSLLLPLVAFNVPLALVLYMLQAGSPGSGSWRVDLPNADLEGWANAIVGLFDPPVNYPLSFLRDLFVLCLLAPQLGMLLRTSPRLGLLLVLAEALLDANGAILLRDSMLVNFYIGGMAALLWKDLRSADWAAPYCAVLLLGWSFAIAVFDMADRTAFVLVAPLLVWPAASLLMNTRPARWLIENSSASFFTFLLHGPLLVAASGVWRALFGESFEELGWFLIPAATAAACLFMYRATRKLAPRLLVFAGSR